MERTQKQASHHSTSRPFFSKNPAVVETGTFFQPLSGIVQRQAESSPLPEEKEEEQTLQQKPLETTVQRMCAECEKEQQEKTAVQPKLSVGEAGDPYEQEADRVADQVAEHVQASKAPSIQTRLDSAPPRITPLVMRQGEGPVAASSRVEQGIQHSRGSGEAIKQPVRGTMEQALGADFSGVRIHANSDADSLNRSLNARAFTTGKDIYFKGGEYQPESPAGQKLLAHELTHVVQQGSSDRLIQAERIVTRGAAQHTGLVGAVPPGAAGPPVGAVEVRTGEEIELAPGSRIPNVIAIEYSGALLADSRWLQFVWFELTAATPQGTARVSGNVPTSSGVLPFTTNPAAPTWAVDSGSNNPFYESGGANLRNASSTTMFDAPGGGSAAPLAQAVFGAGVGATSATFTAHFETYLIQNNHAVYKVPYSASTTFTPPPSTGGTIAAGAIGYTVGAAGPATALPANLRTILHANYAAFRNIQ
jgi:hypothetical protein